jgi:1,4-dihydroxy-6-naphthoate synthase
MKLTLGFSPCPNDTFIFDALVNGKIDTEGLSFKVVLEDIETLNQHAAEGKLDITKLSFPAFFQNLQQYIALPSGAALGNGVGPLLVAKNPISKEEVHLSRIAIPGHHTTANFLLSFAFPEAQKRFPVLFSQIEDAVLNGHADIGLLIHENRFTYQQKGLLKILDLGEYWEQETSSPVPLACIAVKRGIDKNVQSVVGKLVQKSVEFAFTNYPFIAPYVKQHAQAMEEEVMKQHIDLYVNKFSVQLGEQGRKAVSQFYKAYTADKEGLQNFDEGFVFL